MTKIFFNYLIRKDLLLENPLQEITETAGKPGYSFLYFLQKKQTVFLRAAIKQIRTTERFYLSDF